MPFIEALLIICFSALNLFVSLMLLRYVSGSLSLVKLNILSWHVFFSVILQMFISSVVIVLSLEDHYRISYQLMNEKSRFLGWLAIQWVLLGMTIGMVFMRSIIGCQPNAFSRYVSRPTQIFSFRHEGRVVFALFLITLFCVSIALAGFLKLGSLPILNAFSNDINLLVQRGILKVSGLNSVAFNIFAKTILPLMSYVWYIYFRRNWKRFSIPFCLSFFVSILVVTASLAKSPLVFYALGFVFIHIYMGDIRHLRKLLLPFMILFILIAIAYFVESGSLIFQNLSYQRGFGGRILIGQAMGVYFSFDIFGTTREFIGFASLSSFISEILGLDHSQRMGRLLMIDINPGGVKRGISGTLNSNFIAEAWANFGAVGVVLSPLYVGMVLFAIFRFFTHAVKHPAYVALFAFLTVKLPINGGFNDFLYNPPLMVLFAIIFAVNIFSSRSRLRSTEKVAFV